MQRSPRSASGSMVAISGAVGLLALLGGSGAGQAAGNLCFHDGEALDDRLGAPENFSGEYTCKDMDTGKLVLREHHVRGRREGDYAKYEPASGKIAESGRYRDDKLDGVMRRYRDGIAYLQYSYVNGKQIGKQTEYQDGKVARVYLVTAKGVPDTELQFNKKGQLELITCKTRPIGKDDLVWCGFNGKQSTVTLYDSEGRKRASEQYLAGRAHGLSKAFHAETGTLISEKIYENGKALPEGQKEFDREGKLLVKTTCDAGRVNCTETQFFEGGKEVSIVTVRAGTRTVRRTEYYQNGKPQRELVAEGKHFRITQYYDGGEIAVLGKYLESDLPWEHFVPDGVVECREKDGSPLSRETFVKGQQHGPAEQFVVREGKRFRQTAVYAQDRLVSEKIYAGEVLIEESEYMPDGSTKSHREYKPDGKTPKN